jgi:hypothetical protein
MAEAVARIYASQEDEGVCLASRSAADQDIRPGMSAMQEATRKRCNGHPAGSSGISSRTVIGTIRQAFNASSTIAKRARE